jgi:hypothetical protein
MNAEEQQGFQRDGLAITPLDGDAQKGWGYQWRDAPWVGPYPTPDEALFAAFTEANERITQQRQTELDRLGAKQPYTGETDEAHALTAVLTICAAFATMRETPLQDINDPGSGDAFSRALLAASNAYGTLEILMKRWNDGLMQQRQREQRAYRRLFPEES